MAYVSVKLLKRAGLLYVIQIALVALTMIVYFQFPGQATEQFRPTFAGSLGEALQENLLLGVNPIYVNFLASYVLILILAIPAIWLLAHGRSLALGVAVGVLYGIAFTHPNLFTLPFGPEAADAFNNGTWFLLFAMGLMVGWHWNDWNVATWLADRRVMLASLVIVVALLGVAVVDALRPDELDAVNVWFDKNQMAPGRLVSSWVFFVALWTMLRIIDGRLWGARVIRPLATLGSHSLDSVVILTLASILIPATLGVGSESRIAEVLSVVVLLVCWSWAYGRLWRKERRRARAVAPVGIEANKSVTVSR
jgi:hypothetical protein